MQRIEFAQYSAVLCGDDDDDDDAHRWKQIHLCEQQT